MKLKLEHITGERYLGNRVKKILLSISLFIGIIICCQIVFASSLKDIYTFNVTFPSGPVSAGDRVEVKINASVYPGFLANGVEVDMGNGFIERIACNSYGNCSGDVSSTYSVGGEYTIKAEFCYVAGNGLTICPRGGGGQEVVEGICCVTEISQIQVESSPLPLLCNNGVIDSNEECDSSNLNGKTCIDYGFDGGTLTCIDCSINTSQCTSDSIELPDRYPNPLSWENILEFLKDAVTWIFRVGSGLAVLMILIGAFIIVTSAGDPRRAEKGKQTVIWAVIGFVVTMIVNGIIALLKAIMGAK